MLIGSSLGECQGAAAVQESVEVLLLDDAESDLQSLSCDVGRTLLQMANVMEITEEATVTEVNMSNSSSV